MAEHSLTDWQLQCEGPGGQGLRREYKPSITWQALEFSSVWIVCHLKICKVSIRLCQYVRISPKHILTRSWMFEKFVSMVLTLVWTSWLRKVFSNLTDFGCLSLIALKLDEAGFGLEVSVYKNSNWITFKGKLIKQASAFPSQTNKRRVFFGCVSWALTASPFFHLWASVDCSPVLGPRQFYVAGSKQNSAFITLYKTDFRQKSLCPTNTSLQSFQVWPLIVLSIFADILSFKWIALSNDTCGPGRITFRSRTVVTTFVRQSKKRWVMWPRSYLSVTFNYEIKTEPT